ncbi:MAG TPA: group III truncated hemoglobin [Fimbriimonadaceae bacterium]|jgi:hemoglobin
MEPLKPYDKALRKRQELQDSARSIGVSEAFISELVDKFYIKVRADAELGPVFDAVLKGGWESHLPNMKLFWNSVALRTGSYSGRPMEAHRRLTNAKRHHFEIWLSLFQKTLDEIAPNPQVVDFFMGHARQIGSSLQRAMFS